MDKNIGEFFVARGLQFQRSRVAYSLARVIGSPTDEGIPVTDHRVRLSNHFICHPEVKVESRLIFAEPEQFENDGDAGGFAVVNGGSPGRAAPETPDVGTLRLRDLQGPIGTSIRDE